MPRRAEPSFELKLIIWDVAATVGKDKLTDIQRQLDYVLEKRRKQEGDFFDDAPDVRTISRIVKQINILDLEIVLAKLPSHIWKLRDDYGAIIQLAKKRERRAQSGYSQSVIAHDVRIFEESNRILPEQTLREFLDYVDQKREYRSSGTDHLRHFVDYYCYETNQYISDSLKTATSDLNIALRELIEYLHSNNAQGIKEGDDTVYPLFPRANPIFSIYLDQTCNNRNVTTEELRTKFEQFREYVRHEDNRTQLTSLVEKELPQLYHTTDLHPFTRWDYKREYYRGIKELTKLLNQVEFRYRTYRTIVRDTLLT